VAALLHFLIEVAMFKTMSLKAAANPMMIAGKQFLTPQGHVDFSPCSS